MKVIPRDNSDGQLHIRVKPRFAKGDQIEAIHSWKTGYQVLIFTSRAKLEKYAEQNNLQIKESIS